MDYDSLHDVLLDHAREPRHARALSGPDVGVLRLRNARCNDEATVSVRLAGGRLAQVGCVSAACALTTASGSLMARRLSGATVVQAGEVCRSVYRGLLGQPPSDRAIEPREAAAVIAMQRFPTRQACALLPWLALGRLLRLDIPPALATGLAEVPSTTHFDSGTEDT